jgi:beta-glucuronidase
LWQRPSIFNDTLWNVARLQIKEMVTRDYNHPCIVGWGVGNEVWEVPDSVNVLVQRLKNEYSKWDTTRMLNYVSNTIHKRFDRDASAFSDVLMPNDYSGLWHAIPSEGSITEDMVPGLLEKYHRLMPEKPIIISEYGYPEPAFKGGDPARIKHMIRHTGFYAESPYVSGAIYFCLNDYRTHMGEGGQGIMKHRVHGVLDFKGNKKPSYKVLQNLSSPVAISNIEYPGQGKIRVTVAGKHFPAYTVKNYKLIAQSNNKEISVAIPEVKPGQEVKLDFDAPGESGKLLIMRPGGFEVMESVFKSQQ